MALAPTSTAPTFMRIDLRPLAPAVDVVVFICPLPSVGRRSHRYCGDHPLQVLGRADVGLVDDLPVRDPEDERRGVDVRQFGDLPGVRIRNEGDRGWTEQFTQFLD